MNTYFCEDLEVWVYSSGFLGIIIGVHYNHTVEKWKAVIMNCLKSFIIGIVCLFIELASYD